MARRKKMRGVCRICGQDRELSFEHVPPQQAYNKATTIEYSLENWAAKREVKGTQQQGGIGKHTLCEQCNNDTGAWYGNEYVKWSRIGFDVLALLQQQSYHFGNRAEVLVTFRAVYPLRFLKQAITCYLSIIDSSQAEFARNNQALVKFVLDKHEQSLPTRYQFRLRLYQPSRPRSVLRRYSLAGKISVNYSKDMNGNTRSLQTVRASVFSEIAHPPFMLVMTQGAGFSEGTDTTFFKNFGYDDQLDLSLPLKIGQSSSPLPGSLQ